MKCAKCGYDNIAGSKYCKECGAPMVVHTGKTAKEKVVARIKELCGSSILLSAAIAYSASIIFSIVAIIWASSSQYSLVSSALNGLSEMTGMPYTDSSLSALSGAASSGLTVGGIISLIPVIVVIIGMWMVYGAAKSTSSPGMGTGGMTLLQVMSVFNMVITVLQCIVVELAFIALLAASASSSSGGGWVTGLMVAIVLLSLAVYVLTFIAYFMAFKTLGDQKKALVTGEPAKNVSMILIVMLFVFAVLNILSNVGSLVNFFSGACVATAMILIAIWLLQYRKFLQNPPKDSKVDIKGTEAASRPKATLVRSSTKEQIPITSNEFTMGRDSKNSYCISGNTTVGRNHATIRYSHGKYTIIDNNSVNGVSVNGVNISPGVGKELHNGDQISLSDEKFVFNMI